MKLVLPEGHADSKIIASVSGGKDSTAMILALIEAEIDFMAVFADTGWEAPETYEHLDLLEKKLGISIARVGVDGGMVQKIRERAGFPARMQRWCTRELKVYPIKEYHEKIATLFDTETISAVGIRAEESEDRAKMAMFGYDGLWEGYVWRPLLCWSVANVLAIHHRHNIPINPLYRVGFGRVGCWPCIYSNKEEIRLWAIHDPKRVDLIESLEQECADLRVVRNAEEPGRYTYAVASYFQSREVDRYETSTQEVDTNEKARKNRERELFREGIRRSALKAQALQEFPIATETRRVRSPVYKQMGVREIVEWANTARGGKQLTMIRDEPDSGCFRWGMCEPPIKGEDE